MKLITLFLVTTLLSGCLGRKPEKTELKGKPLPSFGLFLADSTTYFNTNNVPNGKPVVLFYFGPHCPYSRAQMEVIIKDMKVLKDIQFYIFTTSPFPDMKRFYEHYKLEKYKNIATGVDYTNFFVDYFKAQGVPYMAIYGKSKRLNEAFMGKIDTRQIKAAAEE